MAGGFDYGQIEQLTNQEIRNVYTGLTAGERFPVGTLGTTQDGRWYRFARAGASTLVPGNVVVGPAPVTNNVDNTAAATAAGATSTTFTIGATAITQNQYKDGWLSVSVTPGAGYLYGLRDHAAVASAGSATWAFSPGESVQVAFTTATRLDLIANPFRGVIQCPATTIGSVPIGVAVSAPTSGQYCWIQVEGAANVLTAGTLIVGNRAVAPTGTAGAAGPETATAATSKTESTIGQVLRVAASTAFSTIDLHLLS